MIELETGVKVTEKTITLKELFDYEFNELQKESFRVKTNGESKEALKLRTDVMNEFIIDLYDVFAYRDAEGKLIILNKDKEVYALKDFFNGSHSAKSLINNEHYFYHNLKDTSIVDGLLVYLTIVEGDAMDCFKEIVNNSRLDKGKEDILELIFLSPWVIDMRNFFKKRTNPARRVLSQHTDKKIRNLNLMNAFISYKADLLNIQEEEYVKSTHIKESADEEWIFYRNNIIEIIRHYGWEN